MTTISHAARGTAGVFLALAIGSHSADAQTDADHLLAAGDTAAAIAVLEHDAGGRPASAEARYHAATLRMARFLAGAHMDEDRERAETHLRYATQQAPDSAKYWLALAHLTSTYGDVVRRTQVAGLVDRAIRSARRSGGPIVADAEYAGAREAWGDYEQQAHRYQFIGDAETFDEVQAMGEWRYVEDFFARQVRPDPGDPGGGELRTAERHLRTALATRPGFVDAAGLLVVLLGEDDRWDEALETGTRLVRAVPDSGRAWALLGLARSRVHRWRDAAAAFDTALQRMTPTERAPFDDLVPLLRGADVERYEQLDRTGRAQLERMYWAAAQPLFLSEVNEVRVEFLARLTYVMHRWSDPARGRLGYRTDLGQVYARYGPPDVWASFGRGRRSQNDAVQVLESERNTVVWLYERSELRFVFSMTPGFGRTAFAGDYDALYQQARNIFPVRFDNVPAVRDLDTILVQFAQFRGHGPYTSEVGVFSFMPIGRMAREATVDTVPLTTAAIVKDNVLREVDRIVRNEPLAVGDSVQIERRSFRLELTPDDYLLRVEARLGGVNQAARSTSVLRVRSYTSDSLMLSDLLVAERVAPRDSSFTSWKDFFIRPSAGRLGPDAPIALLWEVYNLQPDSAGVAHYTVDLRITVREVERRGFAARILGGIGDALGLSAKGDDEVILTYDRDVAAEPGGRQVEYLTVELEDAPQALFGIWVTVTDAVSGQSLTTRRQFVVTDTPLTR